MKHDDQQGDNVYIRHASELYIPDENYDELALNLDDDTLTKMLINSLEQDREYWNQAPWNLQQADTEYTSFVLGDQLDDKDFLKYDIKYKDNRLFTATRAILSYATGQLAVPEVTPSRGDDIYIKGAQNIQAALYQHAADEKVDYKVRAAVTNLLVRKRGYLKLRFDPNIGLNGDIVTENINPEDIIIDRTAGYLTNPNKIYQRIRCTIDELCDKFPKMKTEIYAAYSIVQGRFTQVSRYVTYFECAFTYSLNGKPAEGICWFIPEKKLILDKMKNPNWVYMTSPQKEKESNVTNIPPKGFIIFNYINFGHSYIDETCLVEQALPMQKMLNKRGRQIMENADYVNGRWVASKKAFGEEDAQKLINKGPRTVALVDVEDVGKALANVASEPLPAYVENTLIDARNEIDQMMGTPSVFRGSQPSGTDTLGRDLLVKQQAGALQDDLVRAVAQSMEEYYKVLLQMMRVYYTDDYWFQVKGGDGKYEFILLNGESLDSNVKVGVQVDSTLPLDKASVRQTAMELWNAGEAIDYQTFMEDLGLPNPEIRTERYLKQKLDPINFLRSIQQSQINTDAESDIQLLIANKIPEERDNYDADYFNYFNQVVASNRFAKLENDNPKAQQRIIAFLMAIQHTAQQSANLQQNMLDAAGINSLPMPTPVPKVTEQLKGVLGPDESAQIAGVAPEPVAQPSVPTAPPSSPAVPTQ